MCLKITFYCSYGSMSNFRDWPLNGVVKRFMTSLSEPDGVTEASHGWSLSLRYAGCYAEAPLLLV